MHKIVKEARRLSVTLGNLVRYGRLNPFPRTRRKCKPSVLYSRPDWEIDSSLEFVAARAAGDIRQVHFVQIGAFDGEFDDPIARLVRKYGWRGVLVEPQPQAFQKLLENYADQPQLRFENSAVAQADGQLTLYALRDHATPLASFDRDHLVKHAQRPGDIVETQVDCITLQTLLARHPLPRIDLLLIDAEGYDGEILRSLDFSKMTPPVIRYEHRNLTQGERNSVIELLVSQNYRILLEDTDTIAYRESSDGRQAA